MTKRALIPTAIAAAALALTGCGDSANNAACQQAHRDAARWTQSYVDGLPASISPSLEASVRDSKFRLLVLQRKLQYCN
jgi:hypothetical protein